MVVINEEGFAADLNASASAGVSDILTLESEFQLVTNTSGLDQEVPIAQRFSEDGFLSDEFIATLVPSEDDPDQLVYVVPAGAPKLDGTFGAAGPYVVLQGHGELNLAEVFIVEGAFRVEVSIEGPFMQADGGLLLAGLGKANVLGFLEITAAGLVAAMSVDLDVPGLRNAGVELIVDAQLVINTTDEERTIEFLSDSIGAEPIIAPAGVAQIEALGALGIYIPGTDTELTRITGVFKMHINPTGLAVFANGSASLSAPADGMLSAEAIGVLFITNAGVAAEVDVA